MAVADSLDAMCSDRPYRQTLSFREVKEEMARCSATQFDPEVVAAFFAVAEKKGSGFFKNSAVKVDSTMLVTGKDNSVTGARYLKKSMII